MIAGANDDGLCLFDFERRNMGPKTIERVSAVLQQEFVREEHPLHKILEEQIAAYFAGELTVFDLPLKLAGSPFQEKVWRGLLEIPYGKTRTYKQQAQWYGDEKAIRAIASANGANCLAIIVPCHRVIGTNGSLTGYAGGLQQKKWLLEHEQRHSNVSVQAALF